ncbi:hypothetical protein AB0M45_21905 [Nocardia sp. NPDC051787]|uniref:hypothetical protein n=1 Tax=Nocardia sp. NPDC051787 TaxID=3155415 RepID=UPI003438CC69
MRTRLELAYWRQGSATSDQRGHRMPDEGPSSNPGENDRQQQGNRQREGAWAIIGGAAGAIGVVVAVIFGIVQCSPDSPSASPSSFTASPTSTSFVAPTTSPKPAILTQGHQKLANVQGIDLDTGQIEDQDLPGVDVSPSKTADSLNAMSHGTPRFALPADAATGPDAHDRCRAVAAGSWTKTLPNLYALHIGTTICVRTEQSNLAVLTLTHVPSAAEQYLEFDFVTWQVR